MDLADNYRTFYPNTKEFTFYSAAYRFLKQIISGTKNKFLKLKRIF